MVTLNLNKQEIWM